MSVPGSFKVSGLMLKSLIYFELISIEGECYRSTFSLPHVGFCFCPFTAQANFLSEIYFYTIFVGNHETVAALVLFWFLGHLCWSLCWFSASIMIYYCYSVMQFKICGISSSAISFSGWLWLFAFFVLLYEF